MSPTDSLQLELHVTVLRSENELLAMRPAWEALEDQAESFGLYVTWGYVHLAWQHLAGPGDELWILAVHDEMGRLFGVLPLVRVQERHYGMTLRVLRHIGIWEGDRPGLLALQEPEQVWSALWQALVAQRSEWQVLDLRELDSGSWPLRELQHPGKGFSSEVLPTSRPRSSASTATGRCTPPPGASTCAPTARPCSSACGPNSRASASRCRSRRTTSSMRWSVTCCWSGGWCRRTTA